MSSTLNRVPEKNMKEELMDGTPTCSISAYHAYGLIQTDIFTKWFDNFVHFSKPSAEDPVLLIVERHYSRTKFWMRWIKPGRPVFPLSVSHHILSTKCNHLILVS